MGASQFAYFVRAIYSQAAEAQSSAGGAGGQLHLDHAELRQLASRPRTAEAWAVLRQRAGELWRLRPVEGAGDGGAFPQLEQFSTRVTHLPSAQALAHPTRANAKGASSPTPSIAPQLQTRQ